MPAEDSPPRSIAAIADRLGLGPDGVEPYGVGVAKLSVSGLDVSVGADDGDLVLVTAMTPTTRGAGKTVTTIGLGDALGAIGERVSIAVREPSLGPVFGRKGGAAGGGRARLHPADRINLHFTGDIHAVTSAHDLLASLLDEHLHRGNALGLDVTDVSWKRALDVNDRALRRIVTGLGGARNGTPRETGVEITAASEVMAVLCLADGLADLKRRLGRIVVGRARDGAPVTAGDLGAVGAMAALLVDALRPNLVGSRAGTPAFVHGGPFANIAHGTSSVLAARAGLGLGDFLVTEAGFGADLGAEKFLHLVAADRPALVPSAAVVVATVRSLKCHGLSAWPPDYGRLARPDPEAVEAGLPNLRHHVGVLEAMGLPVVVAINRFADDTDAEVGVIAEACDAWGVPVAVSTVYDDGPDGGRDLATAVVEATATGADFDPLYEAADPIDRTIETIAREVYGAAGVEYTVGARADLDWLERHGYGDLPVCVSKTPYSLTDEEGVLGAPSGWQLTVRELVPSAGAGFVVALTGEVVTMPGLPERPAALDIDVDDDGTVRGVR